MDKSLQQIQVITKFEINLLPKKKGIFLPFGKTPAELPGHVLSHAASPSVHFAL